MRAGRLSFGAPGDMKVLISAKMPTETAATTRTPPRMKTPPPPSTTTAITESE